MAIGYGPEVPSEGPEAQTQKVLSTLHLARGVRREPLHALRQSALCVLAVRCVVQREQSDVSQFLRVQGSQAQSLSHARLRRLCTNPPSPRQQSASITAG